MSQHFGAALRELRQARGISLAELSKVVHYSKGHLGNVERGARASSLELAEACDRALDADGVLTEIVVAEVVPSASEDDLLRGSEVAEVLEAIGRVGRVAGQLCEALNALVPRI